MGDEVQELAPLGDPAERDLVEFRKAREESRGTQGGLALCHALALVASLDGLWEWDLRSDSLQCSDRYAELLGYGKNEIPHTIHTFWDSLHPDDAEAVRTALHRGLEDGSLTTVEHRMRSKTGRYRWYRTRAQVQRDAKGHASLIAGSLHDITEHKLAQTALEDSDSRFRALCENSLGGSYLVQDGCFRYANPALAQILGCEPGELIGASPLEFVHPDDRAFVEEQMQGRLRGEMATSRYEARCVRKDGNVAHVEVLGSRVVQGDAPALIGTMLDITDRKRAEAATGDRLRFEKLLTDLSATFVNAPFDRLDAMIIDSLRVLVEFLGNDRSTLAKFTDDKEHILVTHSYSVGGCDAFPLGPFPVNRLPWFIGQFLRGRSVFVRRVPEDLPPEADKEKRYCETHGIQSNVAIPLKAGGAILGALTFAFLKKRCEWPTEVVTRLSLIGEVFANALLRRRSDESLHAALAENKALRTRLQRENVYLREQVVLKHHHGRIVGQSDALKRVVSAAERVAVTDAPVLLLGETGTGKELLAHTIHNVSTRKGRPMVIVNCASLPGTLIESELFGREAGAYTGAASAQIGRFVVADGSTLFLDEIGEFPLELQAKLLRVLQDGRFERLGSPNTVTVNVRIIAATNRDLAQAVRDSKFRADLYHRLNVFPIHVPPLRERPEDIPPLIWTFVEELGRRMGKAIKSIPRRTIEQLQRYSWPGNVRELSNVIERAMILATGDTLRVELPSIAQNDAAPRMTLRESERAQILRVLQETGWRIRGAHGAAGLLGIKPTTLESRMAKLGIKRENRPSDIS